MSKRTHTFEVDGLLFDNDGVLVDSHDVAASVWNQWALDWAPGFDFHRDIPHGRRLRDVVDQLVPATFAAAAAQQLLDMEQHLSSQVPPITGARELIAQCPNGTWAVVTSGVRAIAEARLVAAGLQLPAAIIAAEDTSRGKPHPDPYLAGAAALGLPPRRCAVFEDADAGILSARAAGIGVTVGVGMNLRVSADVVVPDLSGISFDGQSLRIRVEGIRPDP